MHQITLRPARLSDIPTLEAWDEEPHVAASDPNDDWGWADMLEGAAPGLDSYIAELDGRPIGIVQITDPEREASRYWGETGPGIRAIDIWIGPKDALGRGFGTVMMRLALELCFADASVGEVLIDPIVSNTDAIRFYRRFGFVFVENRRFGADMCAVHKITRDTFQASYS